MNFFDKHRASAHEALTSSMGSSGLMIDKIEISHFRCFGQISIENCRRINVIVGDNGSGKTALLEAMFFALGSSTDLALRFRQQRGLEGAFNGAPRAIEAAIFGDLFHDRDLSKAIEVVLNGSGLEARSLRIERGIDPAVFPLEVGMPSSSSSSSLGAPLVFTWKDASGRQRSARPQVGPAGIQLSGTGEDLPSFFFYAANQPTGSIETASLLSDLSKNKKDTHFIRSFINEFPWIEDLSIEVVAGSPVVHASMKDVAEKIPLPNVSGAINRLVAILLSIAAQPGGLVLVDEMESGIYYKHHAAMWRIVLSFARRYKCQIFTTSHSEEWLEALVEAADEDVSDISLWRVERGEKQPRVLQFSGKTFKAGIESGGEVR